MENVAIKGRGGNDVQHKNWKGKILRIWITIIRHGGLGHEVQESWPYLSNATPWPYELSQARELHLIDKTMTLEPCSAQGTNALLPFCLDRWRCQILPIPSSSPHSEENFPFCSVYIPVQLDILVLVKWGKERQFFSQIS